MPYCELLAERIENYLKDKIEIKTRKMFGGLCFLHHGNMLCGVIDDKLMARVGKAQYEKCLQQKYAAEMNFTGKSMKGMIYVLPDGLKRTTQLAKWLNYCINFAVTLPPK